MGELPKGPDARYDQAKEMYLKGLKLVEISKQLNLPVSTVRRWKKHMIWITNVRIKNERSHQEITYSCYPSGQCYQHWIRTVAVLKRYSFTTKVLEDIDLQNKRKEERMSVKIKISYTDEKEFAEIARLLLPVVKKWKIKIRPGSETYARAYSNEVATSQPVAHK